MKDIILIGDGLGVRTYFCKQIGLKVIGTDISDWAVKNSYVPDIYVKDDITDCKLDAVAKLVVAYDVLEHIPYEKLESAIKNLIRLSTKWILVSVPVIGDPNLLNDPTHIIKESKEWWIEQFVREGLVHVSTPDHFLYKEQLLIFRKVKE